MNLGGRPKKEHPKRFSIGVKVSELTLLRLKILCKERGITMTQLITKALRKDGIKV